jgi:very-short-patch-repair endonuclease
LASSLYTVRLASRSSVMSHRFIAYRHSLKARARELRRDAGVAERKLWFEFLRDLPQKFTRQKPLGRYVADFYCSSQKLVIEIDGDSHFTEPAKAYDVARSLDLAMHGVRVIRFTNEDVMQRFEGVCQEILRVLHA